MQGSDWLVPRAIGYNTIKGWLARLKESTNKRSLLGPESQRVLVRYVDGARLDNCTLSSPAHRLRLAIWFRCSAREKKTYLNRHLPASAVP